MGDAGKRQGPVVVFLGPTLAREEARSVLDAIYLPPARQGSVLSAVRRFEPAAILIVDGAFGSEPAVRHKEILWALSVGVPVIGAASMGALRAAELYPHMAGVGLIYRWYRRFPFAPDDAVAVAHGPPEVSSAPLTRALVDWRRTFRAAARRGSIAPAIEAALQDAALRLNFRDRTMQRLLAALPLPALERDKLETTLRSALVEQKKLDALQALRVLQRGVPPARRAVPFVLTAAFAAELADAGVPVPRVP
jgi:hypothetical protein